MGRQTRSGRSSARSLRWPMHCGREQHARPLGARTPLRPSREPSRSQPTSPPWRPPRFRASFRSRRRRSWSGAISATADASLRRGRRRDAGTSPPLSRRRDRGRARTDRSERRLSGARARNDRTRPWQPIGRLASAPRERRRARRDGRSQRRVRLTWIRASSTRPPFWRPTWQRRSTPRSPSSASGTARSTDPLTRILNRRGLEERLERELAVAQERRMPLSLLVIDCDDFKEINDRAGHEFGDALLREVADVLSRSIPDGAEAARLGGDEFVVMFPGAGSDVGRSARRADPHGARRGADGCRLPAEGLRGRLDVSVRRRDADALLRAGDQALYAAKAAGKDRVASFRELATRRAPAAAARGGRSAGGTPPREERRLRSRSSRTRWPARRRSRPRRPSTAICDRLCKTLVFVVGATACSASRVVGDYIVDATEHALREVSLGDEAAYRIADFPLTAEVLRSGEPRAVSFADGDVDPSEAFILRDLGMNALLMLPVHVRGKAWGLDRALRDAPPALQRRGRRRRAVPRRAGRAAARDRRRHGRPAPAAGRLRAARGRRLEAARASHEVGAAPARRREVVSGRSRATTKVSSATSSSSPGVSATASSSTSA